MKRIVCAFLATVLMIGLLPISALAAEPFSTVEIFGHEDRCYITVKENVPLRAVPVNTGAVLEMLPKNYPLQSEGLYRTKKGTLWLRIKTEQFEEAWVFTGNVELHSHTYEQLEEFGFEFCTKCGNLRGIRPDATLVDVDALHIALAAASILPGIGNGFDILDGMVCLAEGDLGGAALSFASAIPVIGSLGNAVKVSDTAVDVIDTTNDTMRAAKATDTVVTAIRLGENTVLVASKSDSGKLARNMRKEFMKTGKDRFYDCADYMMEKGSEAAHHIVAGGDGNEHAALSRALLAHVGIDINDAENGVFLVQKAQYAADGVVHSGRHSATYYKIVHDRLFAAYDAVDIPKNLSYDEAIAIYKEAIIKELDKIADTLMYTTDIPLY